MPYNYVEYLEYNIIIVRDLHARKNELHDLQRDVINLASTLKSYESTLFGIP